LERKAMHTGDCDGRMLEDMAIGVKAMLAYILEK
jgi:hypothetical protein